MLLRIIVLSFVSVVTWSTTCAQFEVPDKRDVVITTLEKENAALRAQVIELKQQLGEYKLQSWHNDKCSVLGLRSHIAEYGMTPAQFARIIKNPWYTEDVELIAEWYALQHTDPDKLLSEEMDDLFGKAEVIPTPMPDNLFAEPQKIQPPLSDDLFGDPNQPQREAEVDIFDKPVPAEILKKK